MLADSDITQATLDQHNNTINTFFAQHATNITAVSRATSACNAEIDGNPDFKSNCVTYLQQKDSQQSISSLLIMPVQRLPRYVLLISELKRSENSKSLSLTPSLEN